MFQTVSNATKTVAPLSAVEVLRMAIVDAMSYTNGDVEEAAKTLMIGRSTLYRKLAAFEIKPYEYGCPVLRKGPISIQTIRPFVRAAC